VDDELDAGEFGAWLVDMRAAIAGTRESDVPCGDCTACCTSSQFIVIEPDETDALAHIPSALLFPAPLRPPGYKVMGFDKRGHCPMFKKGRCSIYEHRPRTCRTYDCRVFPATGVAADGSKPLVAQQIRRWRFTYADEDARVRRDALLAAARFVEERDDLRVPSAAATAVLAVNLHELFLSRTADGELVAADPDAESVSLEAQRLRAAAAG
jgi:Fe-S-cluster containining protein